MSNLETEKRIFQENREFGHEERENKEDRESAELKAAAAMERADFLSKEVKTSQNQMQNIIVHMQAVMQAIKQLRQALALPDNSDQESSLQEDQKRAEQLQNRIAEYKTELQAMKEELILEHIREARKKNPQIEIGLVEKEARGKVEKLYLELGVE